MARRIMLIFTLVLVIIINIALIILLIWAIMSPRTIRKYKVTNSISEKFAIIINGEKNGFFINSVKCNNWGKFVMLVHDAGGGTILNKSEKNSITLPIICAKCYTIIEKFNYIKGLKLYKKIELEKGEYDS